MWHARYSEVMPLPSIGTITATVVGVSSASIHGDVYYDALVVPEGTPLSPEASEDEIRAVAQHVRVPNHLLGSGGPPRPGERLGLTFLLGQLSGLKRGH